MSVRRYKTTLKQRAKSLSYYYANKEKCSESAKKRYLKNRNKFIRKATEWNRSHPEKHRQYDRKYYAEHGDRVRAHARSKYDSKKESLRYQVRKLKDPDGVRAYARMNMNRWYKRNPGRAKSILLKSKYKITLEQYHQRLRRQKGVCAICRRHETAVHNKSGNVRALSVDHCHKSGKFRGLLCAACNRGLGNMGDDPSRLVAAARYLRKNGVK